MQVLGTSVRWLMKSDDRKKQLQFCLLFGMAIGMLGHGFMFGNKLMNHDELEFYSNIGIAGVAAGRYVLHLIWKLFSDFSTPWLNGILGVLALSFAGFFLSDAFDWRCHWQWICAEGLIVLFPINIDIFCYMYEAHGLMMGVMFACMAPWMMRHGGKGRFPLTVLMVMLATGVYQINLMLAIGLLILYVVKNTVEGVSAGETGRRAWALALECAFAAIAGMLVYLVGLKVIAAVGGVKLNEYQGMDTIGQLDLTLVPGKIVSAYQTVWQEYVTHAPDYVNGRTMLFRLPLFLLGIAGLTFSVLRSLWMKKPGQAVLLALCGLLLPLVCCGIFFMGDDFMFIHIITFYPMLIMLVLPMAFVGREKPDAGWLRRGCALGLALLYMGFGVNNVILSNQAYLRHYQAHTRATHFANRLASRVEALDGYRPGTPLKTWGYMNHEDSLLYFEYDFVSRFLEFGGIRMELDYMWPFCAANFMNAVIGLPVSDGQYWEPETPEQLAQIEAMPCYPKEGSVAMVGEVCVVKFNDW